MADEAVESIVEITTAYHEDEEYSSIQEEDSDTEHSAAVSASSQAPSQPPKSKKPQ